MILRKLEINDLDNILEWMQDPDISSRFRFNSNQVTKDQVKSFILSSLTDTKNLHYAIADENNDYLGTISLKNIDQIDEKAEYSISLRHKAIGKNISKPATDAILYVAFIILGLNRVYLNVLSTNARAIKFYEKYGFSFEGEFLDHLKIEGIFHNLKWFGISKKKYMAAEEHHLNEIKLSISNNLLKQD